MFTIFSNTTLLYLCGIDFTYLRLFWCVYFTVSFFDIPLFANVSCCWLVEVLWNIIQRYQTQTNTLSQANSMLILRTLVCFKRLWSKEKYLVHFVCLQYSWRHEFHVHRKGIKWQNQPHQTLSNKIRHDKDIKAYLSCAEQFIRICDWGQWVISCFAENLTKIPLRERERYKALCHKSKRVFSKWD